MKINSFLKILRRYGALLRIFTLVTLPHELMVQMTRVTEIFFFIFKFRIVNYSGTQCFTYVTAEDKKKKIGRFTRSRLRAAKYFIPPNNTKERFIIAKCILVTLVRKKDGVNMKIGFYSNCKIIQNKTACRQFIIRFFLFR